MSKEDKSKMFKEVIAYNCVVMTAQNVRSVKNSAVERVM